MRTGAFVIHLMWHDLCDTPDFIIKTIMRCIWSFAPNPAANLHCNNLVTRIVWHIDILDTNINSRLQTSSSQSELSLSTIGNFLINCYTKYQSPSALRTTPTEWNRLSVHQ